MKKKLIKRNAEDWIYFIMLEVFRDSVTTAPFFSKKPNNNTDTEDSLAIMMMSAVRLFVEIRKQAIKKNYEISAILLRSLLEINANVNYFYKERKNLIMAKKFLETSKFAHINFLAINSHRKPKHIDWASKSISERVQLLGPRYIKTYKYLSSYTHSDAGFLASYTLNYRKFLKKLFVYFSAEYLWNIMDRLAKLKMINKNDLGLLFYKTIKKRLSQLAE